MLRTVAPFNPFFQNFLSIQWYRVPQGALFYDSVPAKSAYFELELLIESELLHGRLSDVKI